jgi:hypothetical protein
MARNVGEIIVVEEVSCLQRYNRVETELGSIHNETHL